MNKPALTAFLAMLALGSLATAGSLTPPGSPASTMNTLEELFDSIAGTFDSSTIVADQNGSLIEHLKYIEANMSGGVGSDSLDFDEFEDAMDLDANTSIASHGFSFSVMGNVGIGTASPVQDLEVEQGNILIDSAFPGGNSLRFNNQTFNATSFTGLTVPTARYGIQYYASGSEGAFTGYYSAYGGFRFYTGNDNVLADRLAMVITTGPVSPNSGNVGIGEPTPEQKLTVGGNILASASGNVDLILNSTTSDDARFTIRSVGASDRLDILGSASQAYVSILDSGNVGIGMTTPNHTLYVSGLTTGTPVLFQHNGSGINRTGLNLNQPDTTDGNELQLTFSSTTTGGGGAANSFFTNIRTIFVTHDNATIAGALTFLTANGGSPAERMRITPSGALGIGDSTPDAKLDVVGSGLFDAEVGIGGALNVGSIATTSYSRFGTATTTHSLSAASDLLISSLLEVDGQAYFDSNASVSGTLETGGMVINGHLLPGAHDTYDLGSSTVRWRDLYLASGSLHIGTSGDEAVIDYNVNDDYLAFKPNGSVNRFQLFDTGAASLSNTLYVTSGGNVGIGTANPDARFEVVGTTASISNSIIVNTGSNDTVNIRGRADANTTPLLVSRLDNTEVMSFRLDGSSRPVFDMLDPTTGGASVSLGITSVDLLNRLTINRSGNPNFLFRANSDGNGTIWRVTNFSRERIAELTTSGVSAPIFTLMNPAQTATISFQASSTAAAHSFIVTGGNFGIGDSTPEAKFEVVGGASISGSLSVGAITTSGHFLPGAHDTYDLGSSTVRWRDLYLASGSLHIGTSGDEAVIDYNVNDDYLAFKPNGSVNRFQLFDTGAASLSNTLYVTSGGNVGIGTANVDAKLEINGTASISNHFIVGLGNPTLTIRNNGANSTMATFTDNTNGNATIGNMVQNGSGLLTLNFMNTTTGVASASFNTALLYSAGKVHIGGNNPPAGIDPTLYIQHPSTTYPLYITSTDLGVDKARILSYFVDGSSNTQLVLANVANTATVSFNTTAGGSSFISNGNLGIGNRTPDARLDVTGNILASTSGNVDLILKSTSAVGDEGLFRLRSAATNERLDILNGASSILVTIASNGNFGILDTTPTTTLDVAGNASISGQFELSGLLGSDADDVYVCRDPTSNKLTTGGTCTASSIRFKKNVEDLEHGLDWVRTLRPVTFDWKHNGEPSLGFIAEEVNEVSPLLAIRQEGEIFSVNYQIMTAVLTKAVQEQQEEIDALRAGFAQGSSGSLDPESPWFSELFAAVISRFAELLGIEFGEGKVKADQLCAGEVCVDEQQLEQLLELTGGLPENEDDSEEEAPTPESTPESTPGSQPEETEEPTPEPEPQSPEPAEGEPAPEEPTEEPEETTDETP